MTVVVTGGTGLVGEALIKKLIQSNYTVHNITRQLKNPETERYREFSWPESSEEFPIQALSKKSDYGVVNLAGEPISSWPWTRQKKEKIYFSRVNRTQQLVSFFKEYPPKFFISASAVGIYGERGEQALSEKSNILKQSFFLQKVCLDWEKSALSAHSICRTVIFRLGIILSYKKGFLYEQNKWVSRGIAPFIISLNDNWLSWISIEDLTSLILWAVQERQTRGIYNAVSPQPVTLKQFYFDLKRQNQPKKLPFIYIPSPLFLLKKIGGEMLQNLLISSKVFPTKALSEGFIFKQEDLKTALSQLLETKNKR